MKLACHAQNFLIGIYLYQVIVRDDVKTVQM